MTVESLGMIEVRGYLGAVVAADAALKAADVSLQDVQITAGGLSTVLVRGDVAAVKASVEAGVASINQLNCLISHYVIARLDGQTNNLTTPPSGPGKAPNPKPPKSPTNPKETIKVDENVKKPKAEENKKTVNASQSVKDNANTAELVKKPASDSHLTKKVKASQSAAEGKVKDKINPNWATNRAALQKMKVTELRHQAYQMNLKTMSKVQIKSGNKNNLIKAILRDLERRKKS